LVDEGTDASRLGGAREGCATWATFASGRLFGLAEGRRKRATELFTPQFIVNKQKLIISLLNRNWKWRAVLPDSNFI
jgi:hypothetical protein